MSMRGGASERVPGSFGLSSFLAPCWGRFCVFCLLTSLLTQPFRSEIAVEGCGFRTEVDLAPGGLGLAGPGPPFRPTLSNRPFGRRHSDTHDRRQLHAHW